MRHNDRPKVLSRKKAKRVKARQEKAHKKYCIRCMTLDEQKRIHKRYRKIKKER